MEKATAWRSASASVNPKAAATRPGLPCMPGAGGISLMASGATGVGGNSRRPPEQAGSGRSRKKALRARWAQPVRSLPRTLWPVWGIGDQGAPGMRWATDWASSSGVRRSSRPSRISVFSCGSGWGWVEGAAVANGHCEQTLSSGESSAVARSKGTNAESGVLASAWAAWAGR